MRGFSDLLIKFIITCLIFVAIQCEAGRSEIYDFKVKDINGDIIDMSAYRGTVCTNNWLQF